MTSNSRMYFQVARRVGRGWRQAMFLLWISVNAARADWLVDAWTVKHGLPQNSVISLVQSHDGYLWLGTLNGFARFDGIRFTHFNESNTRGLNSGRIVHLFEDSRRNLWLGTETAGAAMIHNGELLDLDLGRGSQAGRLLAACEDADGSVWLYTAGGQLARYRAGKVDVWQMAAERPSNYRMVVAQPGGGLWVGTDWGTYDIRRTNDVSASQLPVQRFLPAGRKLDSLIASRNGGFWRLADGRIQQWSADSLLRDLGEYPWRDTPVSAACEDAQGNLVVGTLGAGVFWFGDSNRVENVSTNDGLSNSYVLSLLTDREGNLWVGTDGGGLNRLRRSAFEVVPQTRDALVQSVCSDGSNGVWLARAGDALHLRDGMILFSGASNGLESAYVSTVLVDTRSNVWVGTRNAGLFRLVTNRFEPAWQSPSGPNVFALHEDRQGNLWVGMRDGLLRRDVDGWKLYSPQDGLSAKVIRALADDAAGNLWIGTEGGGVSCLQTGKFTVFRKSDGLPSDFVTALNVDGQGGVWVGTDGGGLARWWEGRWSVCASKDNQVSDNIGYLLGEGRHLWMGSYAGLARIPQESLEAVMEGRAEVPGSRTYGETDGLPTSECSQGSQPAACRTADGRLWFATIRGLVTTMPQRLSPNTNLPPVVVESVLIDGQPMETNLFRAVAARDLTLSPRQQSLEVRFTSLSLTAPEHARFRYRLEGHEDKWVEAGDTRLARYPKLPAGDYRFVATASNEDGLWNPVGASFAVKVLPPFWQKRWFVASSVVALLLLVVSIVHYLSTQKLYRQLEAMRQQEALEKERSRIARDLHDQLGANLTQVALLGEFAEAEKDQPAEVESHARQITQTARETTRALDEIVWAANPANDTLESLVNYACKYAQDYAALAGLAYRLDAPKTLPKFSLPPEIRHNVFLAFKEAMNNMVKHAEATEARFRVQLNGDELVLELADNGRGLPKEAAGSTSSRNGLRNMRRRMEDIGGHLVLEVVPSGGTLVRLSAPLSKRKN